MTSSVLVDSALLLLKVTFSKCFQSVFGKGRVIYRRVFEKLKPRGCILSIMDYTGRLRQKRVPFSGWRYIKE